MQRILSIYDWQTLATGEQASILSDVPDLRAVRLRVNAPQGTALYITQDDIEDEIFLAYVIGLDEINFNLTGNYKLFGVGGSFSFDTLDGTRADVEPVDQTSFTNIVERVTQNPEVLLMERKMQENIERRMSMMYASFDQMLQQKDLALEAARKAATAASTTAPEPDAGQVSPGNTAEPASGATGGDGDGK